MHNVYLLSISIHMHELQASQSINQYIYKSRNLIRESMKFYHVAHSLKFSLFRLLNQQSLHLYQSINS